MKNGRFFAFVLSAAMLFSASACSKEPVEHEEQPIENTVIIKPAEEPDEPESKTEIEHEEEPSEPEEPEIPKPEDESVLILVNPWNHIPEDYAPELETVQGKYNLDKKAAENARNLLAAAKEAGFNMQLCSAYRTVQKSAQLYANKVNEFIGYGYSEADAKTEAAKWVAPPGTSEHHTGLAMDLVSADYWNYYSDLEHDYEKFDSFKWMYEHCAEFGFILRFPKDKQDITGITYEPWHYRFVGVEAAKYIMENGLCLEEYLELIK